MKFKILYNNIIKLVKIFIKISMINLIIILKIIVKINNPLIKKLKMNNKIIIPFKIQNLKQYKIFFLNNLFKSKIVCLKQKIRILSKNNLNKNHKILLFLKNK